MPVTSIGNTKIMFSIEQIELIRRLRNSGITKEQVVEAFDSLERIDGELGTLFNTPLNKDSRYREHTIRHQPQPFYDKTNSHSFVHTTPSTVESAISRFHPNVQETFHNGIVTQSTSQVPMNSRKIKAALQEQGNKNSLQKITTVDSSDNSSIQKQVRTNTSQYHTETQTAGTSMMAPHKVQSSETNNCLLDQGREHKSSNSSTEDSSPRKKAKITGLIDLADSDSNKQFIEMIESAVQERKGSVEDNGLTHINGQKMLMPDGKEIMMSFQRRERFTFREKHLEVLESCFKENPYPSYEHREAIANLCNSASSNNGERKLLEREKVTAHMVLNWFANSRKEVKRLAKQGGMVASASILPSRINKNKSLLSNGVTTDVLTDETMISDQSNDSSQLSTDERGQQDDFIVIKCEDDT